jgi:hypothetical protein
MNLMTLGDEVNGNGIVYCSYRLSAERRNRGCRIIKFGKLSYNCVLALEDNFKYDERACVLSLARCVFL